MSFLSGLFGRTKYEPITKTVQTVSKLPEEIAPYVTDILEDAQAQYDKAVAEGYQPYTGETIAPRTPEEEQAIAGLRSLIGGQGQYIDEAEAALRGIPTEFTAETAQKFMSPYQQAVIDIEKRKAEEDFQRKIMPEFEKQAVQAGGMSGLGSRAGVQAAILGSEFSKQLGDIQSKGQQKAYEDAYRQFTDQAARTRAQATDLQNLGLTRFQTGLAEQGLGQQLAQQDRQEAQNILDKKFLEYLEREQFPQQKLAEYSGLVYGNPLAKMADTTATTTSMLPPNAPGIGQQLLGLGLSGLNVFGMGGGFDGGFSFKNLYSGNYKSPLKTGGRIVYKQEGGGLGNLPVVKRQVGSKVAISGRLTPKQLEHLRSLRPANTDIRNLLRDYQGKLPSLLRDFETRKLPSYKETASTYAQRYKEKFSPKLKAYELLGVDPVNPVPETEMEKLQDDMANYKGQDDSFEFLRGNPLVDDAVQRRTSAPLQKKATGLPALAANMGQKLTVDDAAKLIAAQGAEKIDAAAAQRRALADLDLADREFGQPGPMTTDASGLTSISASGDIRSRFKRLGFDPNVNLDKAIRAMFTSYEEGQRKSDALIKELEKNPKEMTRLAKNKIDVERQQNEALIDAQAKAIEARNLIDADFDKQDEDALNKYEERKMKRFEDRAKAWPGAEFAAAIDAGMDEPSIVTMLTKVMNVGVAGVSKRAEKIDNELDKFRDAMEEKREALRGKKKTSAVNKASREEEFASDKILKEFGIKLKTADLPIQERKVYLAGLNAISQLKGEKFTRAAKMTELLTEVIGETTSGSGITLGEATAGLDFIDPKKAAENLTTLNIIPAGAKFNPARRGASEEAIRLIEEGKQTGEIKLTKDVRQAKRNETMFLLKRENIEKLRRAAERADPNIKFIDGIPTFKNPGSKSKDEINKKVSALSQMVP